MSAQADFRRGCSHMKKSPFPCDMAHQLKQEGKKVVICVIYGIMKHVAYIKSNRRCPERLSWGFRLGPTQTGLYGQGSRLEAWNFGVMKKRDCTICVAKTKALISCAVTVQLICVFVFA